MGPKMCLPEPRRFPARANSRGVAFCRTVGLSLVCWLGFQVVGCGRVGQEISFNDVLMSLTNVRHLAASPSGQTMLVSSYDRTGGNDDWAQWPAAKPGSEVVLADLKGPGCIKRIWMTSVPAAYWLFYFDGERDPRIRMTTAELFGGKFPFVPPLSDCVSSGSCSYVPLPFAKSLRVAVVLTPDYSPASRAYFHINHMAYDRMVKVESFPRELAPASVSRVRDVIRQWKGKAELLRETAARCGSENRVELAPGAGGVWFEHNGSGMLDGLALKLGFPGGTSALQRAQALRDLILRMYWDGSASPSVDVPLGDFFCNALGGRSYASLTMGFVDGAYVCRFPMPFAKSVRVEIRNDGPTALSVQGGVILAELPRGDWRYFHSRWNGGVGRGMPFGLLDVEGRGHYVGCYLTAHGMDGSWNILEGDEVIRVDGDQGPLLHGTGLEDYFNGAWYYFGLFDRALYGLLEKAAMRTSQYRWHVPDPVRFSKRVSVGFEFGDGNRSQGYMSGVAYWYHDRPLDAGSRLPVREGRQPPMDRLAPTVIMAELFELERIGHFSEAHERCLAYAERYKGTALGSVMRLRADAYLETMGSAEDVRKNYRMAKGMEKDPHVMDQVESLLWLSEAPTNALLGINANVRFRIYLDGVLLIDGDSPSHLATIRTGIGGGRHVLTAEVLQTRSDPWFSMCLRSSGGDVLTDDQWERAFRRPSDWPLGGNLQGSEWMPVAPFTDDDMLPRMGFWQMAPNAFVSMQSARQLLRPWRGVGSEMQAKPVFLRRAFVVSEPEP